MEMNHNSASRIFPAYLLKVRAPISVYRIIYHSHESTISFCCASVETLDGRREKVFRSGFHGNSYSLSQKHVVDSFRVSRCLLYSSSATPQSHSNSNQDSSSSESMEAFFCTYRRWKKYSFIFQSPQSAFEFCSNHLKYGSKSCSFPPHFPDLPAIG